MSHSVSGTPQVLSGVGDGCRLRATGTDPMSQSSGLGGGALGPDPDSAGLVTAGPDDFTDEPQFPCLSWGPINQRCSCP